MNGKTLVDLAPGLERAFLDPPVEGSYTVDEIEGTVPSFLQGTCYANGPARFGRGGVRYRHWLDGDGMVRALRFDEEGVHFTNRYVRGPKQVEEEEAGRALYRTFGTAFEGDQLVRGVGLASPFNVSAIPWNGTLLACGEQGLPWELDPLTLESRGPYTFGDRLNPIAPFAAHAKVDPESDELINFGISFAANRPSVNLYRFHPEEGQMLRRRLPLPYPASMHDFAVSRNHAVFYVSPYVLNMDRLMADRTLMESLVWKPELGSRLLIVRRSDGEPVADIALSEQAETTRYALHLANAFDDGDHLTVDVLELDRPIYDQYHGLPALFQETRRTYPVRRVVDLATGKIIETRTLAYNNLADFPQVDPRRVGRPYRRFWMAGMSHGDAPGRKFFDQLVACDWQRGTTELFQTPPGTYLAGEPAFAPDPTASEPEQGAVLCPTFEPNLAGERKSAYWIFDSRDLAAGPVAKVPLREPVDFAFHACFEGAD